jgi:hypothetical protein
MGFAAPLCSPTPLLFLTAHLFLNQLAGCPGTSGTRPATAEFPQLSPDAGGASLTKCVVVLSQLP